MRLYRIPLSTNVERVALALAHKGLPVESVWIDPGDRSEVERVSGQPLVPVLEHDGQVIVDSMTIVSHLDERFPERPLYPSDPARRAELLVFIDWFNRVWKVPPNAIEAELGKPSPDRQRIAAWERELAEALELFEAMLDGRDHLFGDEFSAADCCAFPLLRYAILWDEGDESLFHEILRDTMRLDGRYPRLEAWIHRVNERPRA